MTSGTWLRLDQSKRDAVTAAARAEFAANGYSGASLNVIARNAGVAKGSLFQYFQDKSDLFTHLALDVSDRSRDNIADVLRHLDMATAPTAFWQQYLAAWLDHYRTHAEDLAIYRAVYVETTIDTARAVRAVLNRNYREVLLRLLRTQIDLGLLRPDADIEVFAATMIVVLPHILLAGQVEGLDALLGLYGGGREAGEAAVTRLLALTMPAMLPAPALAPSIDPVG